MRAPWIFRTLTACVALQWCVACGPQEQATLGAQHPQDENELTDGPGPLRGHEDVTRFGVALANARIQAELGVPVFYPPVTSGDSCLGTTSTMLKGNCATDTPDSLMIRYYGVSSADWQTAGSIQDLHFLRNYQGVSGVVGAKAACTAGKARISNATVMAVHAWRLGDLATARYWLGHALHTIQDSFSSAHTVRMGTALHTLVDVCTYGRTVSGVCKHATVDSRDRIWNNNVLCQLNPLDRSWGCLTPFAQGAAHASAGYLLTVARILTSRSVDVATPLGRYFDTATDAWSGLLNCATLW